MPVPQKTRSGRVVKNSSTKQSKLDALEILERQRRGEKIDVGNKEDEPLFEDVNEEEYKRTRKGGFVVDAESDDEYGSDDDFIDNEYDDDDENEKDSRGNKKRGSKKELKPDANQPSMKKFMGSSTSKFKSSTTPSSHSSDSKIKSEINQDDILSGMLFDIPVNRAQAALKKPVKPLLSRLPQSSDMPKTLKTKANFETKPFIKKQRTDSPPPSECQGAFDNLHHDDDLFDDSMPLPATVDPTETSTKETIYDQMATQESISSNEPDETGIEATPLNADLKSNLEFHDLEDGLQYTRMYWVDCCEDQNKNPGVVYFFGRIYAASTKQFVSCCVIVKNVRRSCYLLINPDSTYEEVVGEFKNIIAKRYNIKNFTCKKVTKKYAFSTDSSLPLVSDYVKIDYTSTQSTLPTDLTGVTFKCALNTTQTPMERIILDLKLRGPCWLRLIDPVVPTAPLTWTRVELILETPANLNVEENSDALKQPYFSVLSLALKTHMHPTIPGRSDIVAISVMLNKCFYLDQCLKRTNKASGHFIIMTKPSAAYKDSIKLPFDFQAAMKTYRRTRFELVDNERDLLSNFMEKFMQIDPDIVVGHDLLNFDYETLVRQMLFNKLGIWSQLGRFKRSTPAQTKKAFPYLFSGRILCDIKKSAEELIQSRSYDLTELSSKILNKTRVEYTHDSQVEAFKSSQGLMKLLDATWDDVDSIFSILVELNVIPLALKITNITGNILSRTLAAGRSERNEFLLLHAFHEENFICPEKQSVWQRKGNNNNNNNYVNGQDDQANAPQGRKKAAYTGGLVLEPKAGFYETCVLLMDFNSLYPSIIQEFNICFSTVQAPESPGNAGDGEIIAALPDESLPIGVLPKQLKNLVDRRRQVKRLLADCKEPMQKMLFDIEQRALKLTANSMYGCLGFEYSRFYAKHLAALVTFKGREILLSTKAMVEKLGYEVSYGDTDSLMINTKVLDYDTVIEKGNSIKSRINETFKLLEIDIDGVYKPLLLLKKKIYAGASLKKVVQPDGTSQIVRTIETKGLDTVRRDRAVIAKEAGERVLSMILDSDKDVSQIVEDIHSYLKELGTRIQSGEFSTSQFLISKQLNKNPEDYRDTKGIGHVSVALRYNNDPRRSKKMRSGDTVEYVICLDGTGESANQRCYSLEEVMAPDSNLKIDYEYYLCQQIHPVMTRICEVLPITNAYVLAEMLGVESSGLLHLRNEQTDTIKKDQLISRGESRFNSCKPLVIQCPNCNLPDEISTRVRKNKDNKFEMSLTKCNQCQVRYPLNSKHIVGQLLAIIRQLTIDLYSTRFVCCDHGATRNVFGPLTSDGNEAESMSCANAQPLCNSCHSTMVAEMNDSSVDLQLGFFKHLFNIHQERDNPSSKGGQLVEPSEDLIEMYEKCFHEVDIQLRISFINNIDGKHVMSMICSGKEYGKLY